MGSYIEKLLGVGEELWRWGGRVFLQGEQQVQGHKYVLEAESHCGQSRMRPWPTDRREDDLRVMKGRAF